MKKIVLLHLVEGILSVNSFIIARCWGSAETPIYEYVLSIF